MNYEKDTRTLTIEELEKILIAAYGNSNRSSGCFNNGKWFSIDDILSIVSDSI